MNEILNETLLDDLRMLMEDEFPSLMETFLTESARQFDDAKSAWSNSDLDLLRRSVHTLKGSCANVGAEILLETCASLELSAKMGCVQDIPDLLDTVGHQLELVNVAIQSL